MAEPCSGGALNLNSEIRILNNRFTIFQGGTMPVAEAFVPACMALAAAWDTSASADLQEGLQRQIHIKLVHSFRIKEADSVADHNPLES